MATYRNLLLNQITAEIDDLIANPPAPGTELRFVYDALVTGPSSTDPDYVIGWIDQVLFNANNPQLTNLNQQGQQIIAALGVPTSLTGSDPAAGTIPVRLAEALYAETGLAQTNPGAVQEIQDALGQAMLGLPTLANAPSVVIAWVNQAVVAQNPPTLDTLKKTETLGEEKRNIIATAGTGGGVMTRTADVESKTT